MRRLIQRIDGLELEELLGSGVAAVLESMRFDRALFSFVSRSAWTPQRVYLHPHVEPAMQELPKAVRGAEWPLARAPFEAEVVRLATSRLVDDTGHGPLTFAGIGKAWPTRSYVVAPVVARRSVVGLIHADRPGAALDAVDLARVSAHAHFLGQAMERAWLQRRANQLATRVADSLRAATDELVANAAGVGRVSDAGEVGHRSHEEAIPGAGGLRSHPDVVADLSPRELDVLRGLSYGFSNAEIATRLAISPGTVKTHVRNVLRKMDVHSRAAAVALLKVGYDNEGSGPR